MKGAGFILLPIVLLISLMCGVGFISWHALLNSQNEGILLHGLQVRELAGNDTLMRPAAQLNLGSPVFCSTGDALVGKLRLDQVFCSVRNISSSVLQSSALLEGSQLRAKFPQIDYQAIFSNFSACPQVAPLWDSTPTFRPAAGSQLQTRTCLGIIPESKSTHRENLKFKIATALDPSIRVLASLGYIEASGELTLSTDILIIAGGDLSIQTLSSAFGTVHVTLVSATGSVTVQHIDPRVELRVIAWQGAFLPLHRSHQDLDLMPSVLQIIPLGFSH